MARTFVDDTTVEALAVRLAENKRGVMVARDELDAWVRSMDQYKTGRQGADRQFWLSVWSSEPVNVDRKGQPEPIILARPCVGVYGSIQPAILPELGAGREDGLLDRFVFACPERMPSRWTDEEISAEAVVGIQELYEKLRDLPLELDEYDDPAPKQIDFTSNAKEVFTQLMDEHREEMEAPGFPACLLGPWAKLEAYIARLTLILCLMRCAHEGAEERVESKDMVFASGFIAYFKNQARRVYLGLYGENPKDRLARDVVAFLKDRGGHFQDEPHVLHHKFVSDHKPYRPDELSKELLEIAERTPQLEVKRGSKGGGNNKRRILRLSLKNGVPGVPGVPAA